ncbi:hypothetical protein A8713_11230 [Streptomyces sp. SAT1]|uniref:hypothetical protein n=1 Tax=Streptomyces sp. SAT1 TaxID=1849967 RepID=UPI0007F9A77A|nr:hypothetical protein [Streptomyces sp. SAT1]ANH91676.2 hypothetical protein A8713_11230 [Streptomyces sp. SAT1]
MAAMLRGFVHVLAWSLATSAAVTLSWWGVHTVLAGTAYDPPRALPITAGDTDARESPPPASATRRPSSERPSAPPAAPSRTPSPPAPSVSRSAPPADTGGASAASPDAPGTSGSSVGTGGSGASGGSGGSGTVKGYDTEGGRVVFDLDTASASLVSATPGTGWSMQVWKTASWIRVEFTSGEDRVSVICSWHDGPPRVEVGNY